MARYFFHVRSGTIVYLDHEGVELHDRAAAQDHAGEEAARLARAEWTQSDAEAILIEIEDRDGIRLGVVPVAKHSRSMPIGWPMLGPSSSEH